MNRPNGKRAVEGLMASATDEQRRFIEDGLLEARVKMGIKSYALMVARYLDTVKDLLAELPNPDADR